MSKPAVLKKYLLIISGLMWAIVGVMLLRFAYIWMMGLKPGLTIEVLVAGIALGLGIAKLGLSKISRRNIRRINLLPDKACLFAFQAWKSYITIALMVSMGIYLRTHSIVDESHLAVIYTAMGFALLLSSTPYYAEFKLEHQGHC